MKALQMKQSVVLGIFAIAIVLAIPSHAAASQEPTDGRKLSFDFLIKNGINLGGYWSREFLMAPATNSEVQVLSSLLQDPTLLRLVASKNISSIRVDSGKSFSNLLSGFDKSQIYIPGKVIADRASFVKFIEEIAPATSNTGDVRKLLTVRARFRELTQVELKESFMTPNKKQLVFAESLLKAAQSGWRPEAKVTSILPVFGEDKLAKLDSAGQWQLPVSCTLTITSPTLKKTDDAVTCSTY